MVTPPFTPGRHLRVVGVADNELADHWVCMGGACRDRHGECLVIEQFHGMSDFAAYRNTSDSFNVLTIRGQWAPDLYRFEKTPLGESELVFNTTNEYLELLIDGEWISEIDFEGQVVNVWEVDLEYSDNYSDGDWFWEFKGEPLKLVPGHHLWPYVAATEFTHRRWSAKTEAIVNSLGSQVNA